MYRIYCCCTGAELNTGNLTWSLLVLGNLPINTWNIVLILDIAVVVQEQS
jgi:hypothetical protein